MMARRQRGRMEFLGSDADPELLNLYVSAAESGDTSAARHLLELHCLELRKRLDNPLNLYIWEALSAVVKLKDDRDGKIASREPPCPETKYYRKVTKALNLVAPQGRQPREDEAINKGTEVVEQMRNGATLEEAAEGLETDQKKFGGKDAYARNTVASRANASMKSEGK